VVPGSVWAVAMTDYCCSFESLTKEIVCSLYLKAFFQDGFLFEELMLDLAEHCCSMNAICFFFFFFCFWEGS
jgi:hypothetical protein